MPLPCVYADRSKQCTAMSRRTGKRCLNVKAYGCKTCRFHGARKRSSIKRGIAHPAYKHGQETLQAKRERSAKLKELRDIEGAMTVLGVLDGPRWRGRKPRRAK
jgi:hypothetical protein